MNKIKKRVLCLSEYVGLNTGYSAYYKGLLTELNKRDDIELFDLASYCHPIQHAEAIKNSPWKIYPNLPANKEEEKVYESNATNEFGAWKFEHVVLDCLPHVVLDIRDFWFHAYVDQSPLRRYFKTVFMPTADGDPLADEWLDFYKRCDYVLTYQDWSKELIERQSNNHVKTHGSAPIAVDKNVFKFVQDKKQHKAKFGIEEDAFIIGMVARNQKRKLFPELADAFVDFLGRLDSETTKDVYLYWHTSHPDLGWDIPALIKNKGLSHKILLTYFCQNCKYHFPSLYRDVRTVCPRCKQGSATLSSSQTGIDDNALADIYGLFDLYVQYATCEGFGIPAVQAAACGVPVCEVDYSAMTDVVRKLGGYPIPVERLHKECETGRMLAIPDNNKLVEYIQNFIRMPESMRNRKGMEAHQNVMKHYGSWETIAQTWMNVIDQIEPDDNLWASPPALIPPPSHCPGPNEMNDEQFVSWLLTTCLNEPRLVNGYIGLKMLRDLTWGRTVKNHLGMFSNDMSSLGVRPRYEAFNRQDLFNQINQARDLANHWERKRWQRVSGA